MIEDIEGATTEPTRRKHVAVLSAMVGALSLVMLVALFVHPSIPSSSPQAPATSAAALNPIVTGRTPFDSSALLRLRGDPDRMVLCVDDSRPGSPYYLVFEGNGQVMAVPLDPRTGWLSMPCATSTSAVPRINRAR